MPLYQSYGHGLVGVHVCIFIYTRTVKIFNSHQDKYVLSLTQLHVHRLDLSRFKLLPEYSKACVLPVQVFGSTIETAMSVCWGHDQADL